MSLTAAAVGAGKAGLAEFDALGEGFESRPQANASIPAQQIGRHLLAMGEQECGIAGHACKPAAWGQRSPFFDNLDTVATTPNAAATHAAFFGKSIDETIC